MTDAKPPDYDYKAPDLYEWLESLDNPASASIAAAFEAGERYGADLERGALYQSMEEYPGEAEEYGWDLADYVRYRLLRDQESELPAEAGPKITAKPGPCPHRYVGLRVSGDGNSAEAICIACCEVPPGWTVLNTSCGWTFNAPHRNIDARGR